MTSGVACDCVSLDYLSVGLGWFRDGLREFRELFLDGAPMSVVFGGRLSCLLIVMFLELLKFLVHLYDVIDGQADGLTDIGLFFFLD